MDPMKFDRHSYETRRQHAFNKIEWHVPKCVPRGRFLDIGCGIGNGLIAALQKGFKSVVGIDRNLGEFPWFSPAFFNEVCETYGVNSRDAILIEADINNIRFPGIFDVVLMLDTIEHVPDPAAFIQYAAKCLAPGGVLILDTCPLYYSRSGHHLFNHLPPDKYPWVHLRKDFLQLVQANNIDEWSWQRFTELNRVTHQELVNAMTDAGLQIIEEHRSVGTPEFRQQLEINKAILLLDDIDEHTLFEDWVLLVGTQL